MFLRHLSRVPSRSGIRGFSDDKWNRKQVNPFQRTINILKGDFQEMFSGGKKDGRKKDDREWNDHLDTFIDRKPFQTHCDVLVVGGGGIGSSIAYWLKKEARAGLNVVVVEKDPMVRGYIPSRSLIVDYFFSTKKPRPASVWVG